MPAPSVGQRVRVDGAYTAIVREIGVIPDTVPCVAHRGQPGCLVEWDWLNTATGEVVADKGGSGSGELEWVLSRSLSHDPPRDLPS